MMQQLRRRIFRTRPLAIVVATLYLSLGCSTHAPEYWPFYLPNPSWKTLADQAVTEYIAEAYSYKPYLQDYTASGDWLNASTDTWTESDALHFDSNGVPMVNYGGTFYYDPVTVAEFAFTMYGRYIRRTLSNSDAFFQAVDRLLLLEDNSGALRYPFSWQYYLAAQPYESGWVSGMAQGLALSAFARAYDLTQDPKYLEAGNRVLHFLLTSTAEGGATDSMSDLNPSLSRHIIFEEYVAQPPSYTLNGFMFTLLGLYDWKNIPSVGAPLASIAFSGGMDTLRNILPYYDIGGFSAYDMSHITYKRQPHIGVHYHAVHIYLLHALGSVTHDPQLSKYEKLWASYVPQ
jgi:hypothetical protein